MLKFQEVNLPPNFAKLESWKKCVKKDVGSFSYLKDSTLESSKTFMGTFPNGCYVRRLHSHKYQDCGILNEWKKDASCNLELAKVKQGAVQVKRTMFSIPESLSNNIEDVLPDAEHVEKGFFNNNSDQVTPYCSSLDTLFSFNKTYHVNPYSQNTTKAFLFNKTLDHVITKTTNNQYYNLSATVLIKLFIIARAIRYNFSNDIHCNSRMILDTGATRHITGYRHLFINHKRIYNRYVTLGDGKPQLPVFGIGSIIVNINEHFFKLNSVLYVPGIQDTLFSVTEQIKLKGC